MALGKKHNSVALQPPAAVIAHVGLVNGANERNSGDELAQPLVSGQPLGEQPMQNRVNALQWACECISASNGLVSALVPINWDSYTYGCPQTTAVSCVQQHTSS